MPADNSVTEPIVIKANPLVKKLYIAAMLALTATKAAGARAFHRRYQLVAQIVDHRPPLYWAGSYATEVEFFKSELEESVQSVHRNIRIVKLATPEEIAQYTATRIHFAIVYVEAKTKQTVTERGAINFKALRIAIKRDGRPMNLPIDKVSYSEISEATALLTDPTKKTPKTEVAKEVEAAIKRAGVKSVKATVTKTKFSMRGSLSDLNAVCRALADVNVPTG